MIDTTPSLHYTAATITEFPLLPLMVRVLQHDFPIEREYAAGHILTEAEATALNQLMVENIRNNVYDWVTKEAQGKGVLTTDQHMALTIRIARYADSYQFKSRIRSRRLNPFDAAVREIAWQKAEAWGNQQGLTADSPEVFAKYTELRVDREIHEDARELVLRRQAVVNTVVSGLEIP